MKFVNAARWLLYFIHTGLNCILIPWLKRLIFRSQWDSLWKGFRSWATASNRIFGVDVQFSNPERVFLDQQYILVANHRSWFDQLIVAEVLPRPIHFLAKKGYCDMPFFGPTLTELIEVIPVENRKLSMHVYGRLKKLLKKGDTALFFVEGTRGTGKTLLPFNSGAFKYAAKMGIPILPLYLFGTEQLLSKHKSLLTVRGCKVAILVGKPLFFSEENLGEELAVFESDYRRKHDEAYERFDSTILV